MDGYVGQVILFAGKFAPRGWAFCQGQVLSVAANGQLFSLLGTVYGGDGENTFHLPDLRGRAAIGTGQGDGLSIRKAGQAGGGETNQITIENMPEHKHDPQLHAEAAEGSTGNPTNNYLAVVGTGANIYAPPVPATDVVMNPDAITSNPIGGNQPINNMPPYLAMNYIICIAGIWPSQN